MTPTRLTREQAAEILKIGTSRLRALARSHPTQLGCQLDATHGRTYSAAQVRALAEQRSEDVPEGRLTRPQAAGLLGVGIDRLNQLVREDRRHLGRKREASGRTTYSRAAVEALKRRREGARAPRYPRRGSRLPEALRGQQ